MKNIFRITLMIILLFCSSTALAASTSQAGGLSLLTIVFLAFGAIIVVFQAIPGLILFFSMVKGLFTSKSRKLGSVAGNEGKREV
ncbi:MAG TPA: hypothetical protein VJ955_03740 [Desulfuromonadales bacterium]|nr:hypothetical protein [Desulfuromonadales bacterium]